MQEILELLKQVAARLDKIEAVVLAPNPDNVLTKPHYSCREVAELTQRFGCKKIKTFTIRLACNQGRVPEAERPDGYAWQIPRAAVVRILHEGIPPERRSRR